MLHNIIEILNTPTIIPIFLNVKCDSSIDRFLEFNDTSISQKTLTCFFEFKLLYLLIIKVACARARSHRQRSVRSILVVTKGPATCDGHTMTCISRRRPSLSLMTNTEKEWKTRIFLIVVLYQM